MSTVLADSNTLIVSLNPDGIVTAKPYHDDIRVDVRPADVKTKLMENIGYQNDTSEKLAESSCNSSTVELHHVSKKPQPGHACNADACRRANAKSVPSPWHRLKSVFLVVLIVLFGLWIGLMALLITKNAL